MSTALGGARRLGVTLTYSSVSADTETALQRITTLVNGTTKSPNVFELVSVTVAGPGAAGAAVIVRLYDAASSGGVVAQLEGTLDATNETITIAIAPTLVEAGGWLSLESDDADDYTIIPRVQRAGLGF
jgi:hypothetical protein